MSTEKATEVPLLSVKATENSTAQTGARASNPIAPRGIGRWTVSIYRRYNYHGFSRFIYGGFRALQCGVHKGRHGGGGMRGKTWWFDMPWFTLAVTVEYAA